MGIPDPAPDSPQAPQRADDHEIQLAQRIRAGDAGAFQSLFVAYHELLLRFAFAHLGARESAEEVVQEVFLRLWEGRARWDVRESVRAYLFSAVRHALANRLRRRALEERWLRQSTSSGRPDAHAAAPPADAAFDAVELDTAIRRVIDELPERCRVTFRLSREHRLSHEEIAALMGVSVTTVATQMRRALTALRTGLRDWLP